MITTLKGVEFLVSPYIPEFKEAHRQERKWCRRVAFEPWRRFDIRHSRMILLVNGMFHVHPETFKMIEAGL